MNFPCIKRDGDNEVRIVRMNGSTRLILNGEDISVGCLAFDLKQNGADKPEISITLSVNSLEVVMDNVEADVKAKNPRPLVTEAAG